MKNKGIDFLRNNIVFWSRMGFCYDPPIYDENGEVLLMATESDEYAKFHDQFADIGVDVHSHILHSGWMGVDKYDYSLCDRILDKIFESGKVKYLIPRVKLNTPVEWCYENPEEVFVYYDGPRSAEEIKNLVGTLSQDWLGYESPVGYYNAGVWKDKRPNVNGVISLQSFSSEKWLNDASEALRRLIEHIENGKYGDKVIGYHIAYGACGESMFWGRQSGRFGDYGISNQKHFYEWGIKKYGSKEEMYKAWGITEDDEIGPPPCKREKAPSSIDALFKCEHNDAHSMDYDRFSVDVNIHALNTLGKVVKDHTDNKLVGAFYGYILLMTRSAYSGHNGWEKILESPYIDFYAAPKSYYRCGPGEPGGEMAPVASVNSKKLWMDECDNRTHLSTFDNLANAGNEFETKNVILREMCKNTSHNSGLWYMDLGKGWYDDEDLLSYLKLVIDARNRIVRSEYRSIAEIIAVADEECITNTGDPEFTHTMEESLRELQLCGAPIDVILSSDLEHYDFSNAKIIYFMNGYKITGDQIAALKKRIPSSCHLLWLNGGGMITDSGVSYENGADVTGFQVRLLPEEKRTNCVWFEITGGVNEVLKKDDSGKVLAASNKDGDLVTVTFNDCANVFRRILEYCGVKLYAPIQGTVYADNRILSVFAREDINYTLPIDNGTILRNIITGECHKHSVDISLAVKGGIAFEVLSQ